MGKRLENRFDEQYDLSITDFRKGLYAIRDKIKNAFGEKARKARLAGTLAGLISLGGCVNYCTPDYAPTTSLDINPASGQKPLTSLINATSKDPVSEYFLEIDNPDGTIVKTISQPTPIAIDITSTSNETVYAWSVSPNGLVGSKAKGNITVSSSVNPTGSVDFSAVQTALNDMNEKNLFSDGDSISNLALPAKDSSGNAVIYTNTSGATTDGKVNYSVNNGNLTVTANQGVGSFNPFTISYSDNGKMGSQNLGGYLYNILDVKGQIGNDENDTTINGALRVFDANGIVIPAAKVYNTIANPVQESSATDGGAVIATNLTGAFSFQVDERADAKSPLNVTIKAGLGNYFSGTNSASGSWIRTVDLTNVTRDVNASTDQRMNPAITCVPYNTFLTGITNGNQQFVNYMNLVTFQKYGVKNIEILASLNGDYASFSSTDTGYKNLIPAYERWETLIPGLTVQDDVIGQTTQDNNTILSSNSGLHYSSASEGDSTPILPNPGWAIIIPDDGTYTINYKIGGPALGNTFPLNLGTRGVNIDGAVTFLYDGGSTSPGIPPCTTTALDSHEIAHDLALEEDIGSVNNPTPPPYPTISYYVPDYFGGTDYPIDDKGISLNYTKTYIMNESLTKILGQNFNN